MTAREGGPMLAVSGYVRHTVGPAPTGAGPDAVPGSSHLVCATRLDGYDTFLSGVLTLHDGREVKVRILTLDDLTVLLPREQVHGWADRQAWHGILRLPPPVKKAAVPDDVAEAMRAAGLDESAYEPAELTHLLTWLQEAADPHLRQQRLTLITQSLATRPPDPAGGA